jgi:dihydrofolate reductase
MRGLRLIQIAAMSENRVIGVAGALPWDIPEDMKFFRDTTKGHCCIFGRKTLESMGRPLPGRFNVVISRQADYQPPNPEKAPFVVVANLDQALEQCRRRHDEYGDVVYICGGGEIYQQSLSRTDVILLTVIHQSMDGDTYFPEFSEDQFKLAERRDRTDPVPFSFMTYVRA